MGERKAWKSLERLECLALDAADPFLVVIVRHRKLG
jgi:hypothetical protein